MTYNKDMTTPDPTPRRTQAERTRAILDSVFVGIVNLDSHGKSWSYLVLQLTIEMPENRGRPPA